MHTEFLLGNLLENSVVRARRSWEDNIKPNLRQVVTMWGGGYIVSGCCIGEL